MQQPPHNTQLYDILQVNPNSSTQAQITKSRRNLSRKYHPDKATSDSQDDQKLLQKIQRVYDILSNDSTCLFYHKYGILDPNLAALLLMGPTVHPKFFVQKIALQSSLSSSSSSSEALPFETLDKELLVLMGYDRPTIIDNVSDHFKSFENGNVLPLDQQVHTIAAYLVKQI
jgi:curved DNA-binding protein CbpA